jgi:probable rRNA maturation factor
MIHIYIAEPNEPFVTPEPIELAARAALKITNQGAGELTISIENDVELQNLNQQFRQIDQPTDVLSFESGDPDPETGAIYLGDIVISFDRALAQAQSAGHPVTNELQLLAVHGVLHLVGYDHSNDEEKKEMWDLQQKILDQIGCIINKIPEE